MSHGLEIIRFCSCARYKEDSSRNAKKRPKTSLYRIEFQEDLDSEPPSDFCRLTAPPYYKSRDRNLCFVAVKRNKDKLMNITILEDVFNLGDANMLISCRITQIGIILRSK